MKNEGFPEPLRPVLKGVETAYKFAGIKSVEEKHPHNFFVQHYGKERVEADEERYAKLRDQERYKIEKTEQGMFLETLFGRARSLGFFGDADVRVFKTYRFLKFPFE